jgi:hypothetical protein
LKTTLVFSPEDSDGGNRRGERRLSGRQKHRLKRAFGGAFDEDAFKIVSSDPLEIVFETGLRVIIDGDHWDIRNPLKPISADSDESREWGSEAFLDAGDAMFSGEK